MTGNTFRKNRAMVMDFAANSGEYQTATLTINDQHKRLMSLFAGQVGCVVNGIFTNRIEIAPTFGRDAIGDTARGISFADAYEALYPIDSERDAESVDIAMLRIAELPLVMYCTMKYMGQELPNPIEVNVNIETEPIIIDVWKAYNYLRIRELITRLGNVKLRQSDLNQDELSQWILMLSNQPWLDTLTGAELGQTLVDPWAECGRRARDRCATANSDTLQYILTAIAEEREKYYFAIP